MSQPATYDLFRARKYFPELDGLRALSVLLVITVHMYDSGRLWWWLAGMRGVTVFFVLSGFLITTLGLREEEERGALSLSAFYVRRCCRLLPLYYLVLGIYCLCLFALGIAPALRATFAEALPWYLVYLQEVPFYSMLVVQMRDVPFFHSWSLGIEEKFYLVWPLLAFVVWRSPPRRRLLAAGSLWLLLTLAPFGLPLLSPHGRIVGRCLFAYSHILVGCILALMLHERLWFARLRFLGRRSCAALVSLAFLAIHFATPWLAEPALSGYAWHALYAVACGIMLAAVVLGDGPWQRCLRSAPLVFVGRRSYGIYLVHVLAMIAAYRVLPALSHPLAAGLLSYGGTVAIAVGTASMLHLVVERPGMEVGRRWSRWLQEQGDGSAQTVSDPLRA